MTSTDIEQVWQQLDRAALLALLDGGPPAVFATISGAHLYGFSSPDSDVDVRGAYLLSKEQVLGLDGGPETITRTGTQGTDIDWVAHDLRKFCAMLVRHNGYALEQVFSPLILYAAPAFVELKELAHGCITRPVVNHFRGFARGRRLRLREPAPTVKHLLYAYRVFLAGIYVMRHGELESNLNSLLAEKPSPQIAELVERKTRGAEFMALADGELAHHEHSLDTLEQELAQAFEQSMLPLEPTTKLELSDFVIRLRLAT